VSLTGEAPNWQQVKALLAQVLEQPPEDRQRLAEQLSGGDAAMREELLSLLAAAQTDATLQALPPELVLQALQAHMAEPRWAGRSVGPWRIVSLIARGGMGEVYRAERADGQFEQQVALKLLRSGFDQHGLVSRFAAERRILASLDHPNLARVLDGGTTDEGIPYFVMELVNGEPIDRYAQRMRLPVQERLALFRTLCQVVGYAHSKGVVHRDLKTDNILVTTEGVVKLVDFGIAKQLVSEAQNTATAQRMMTLAYSSPEQVRGGEVTPASDVYSLGVVLYRLLTQTSPYGSVNADSGYELTRAICDTEPPPPSRASTTEPALTRAQRRRLRGDLDAVVMMALRKDPSRRYVNAAELGDDIFRHMESLPVRARRGAWSYRVNRFVLRHRVVFGAAMLANVALFAGLGTAVYQSIEADRQRERAERNLATVREFANVLIFDVHKAIAKLPGATAARKLVVDKALAYLEKVSVDMQANPALQLEIAQAYRRLAEIQGMPHNASLGDHAGAMSNYRRVLQILDGLPAAQLRDPSQRHARQLERVISISALGRLLLDRGQRQESRALLEKANAEALALVADSPGDVEASYQLTAAYLNLAEFERPDVKSDAALRWLEKARSVVEPMLQRYPDNTRMLRAAATMYFTQGDFLRDRHHGTSDLAPAIEAIEHCRRLMQRLLKLEPDNAIAKRDFATISQPYALMLHQGKRQTALAVSVLREGIDTLSQLARADPANAEVSGPLATLHGDLGYLLAEQGDEDGAIAELKQAIDMQEKAKGRMPSETMHRVNLGSSYASLAQILQVKAKGLHGRERSAGIESSCRMYGHGLSLLDIPPPVPDYVGSFVKAMRADMGPCVEQASVER
jgi:eukaryotic-like serine/threonine-protein kinase